MKLFSCLRQIGTANKSSVTLPVTPVPTQTAVTEERAAEFYKAIAEDKLPTNIKSNLEALSTEMVKEDNAVADGADEEMLGADTGEEKLADRRDEVKFIKGDHQNGDAKIDINLNGAKAEFTGMSKEELLKYANDPFWVRLRWIFFVAFWAVWVAMLVGAILIIIGAPKCAAPQPLPWFKRGLHAKFGNVEAAQAEDVKSAQKIYASGAIYELPALQTYEVKKSDVEAQIKRLVELYKSSDVKIILDLTANYASRGSKLFQDALANEAKRTAFVWQSGGGVEPPNKWIKVDGNTSAWEQLEDSYVLSQFQTGSYDLKMNSTLVREEFGGVLKHLIGLGVHGFRLKNTQFFLVSTNLDNEEPSHTTVGTTIIDYSFYTHKHTKFLSGLGDVLYDYLGMVKNASEDAFLSVADDMERPDVYVLSKSGGSLGVDLPMYGRFMKTVSSPKVGRSLEQDLQQTFMDTGNTSWLQWNFEAVNKQSQLTSNPSALALFMSLLPGVPVVPVDSAAFTNVNQDTYSHIKTMRLSPSYMHGALQIFEENNLIAYSRIKSGSPGYFVIYNPTNLPQPSNFTAKHNLPQMMTVSYFSDNYNLNTTTTLAQTSKVNVDKLKISAHSALILTYVPVKTE